MFVHTGGGGKGIRPNQHNQQQQQQQVQAQQQQQHLHQNHHQAHHQTQQQQQLQVGSIVHHTSQTLTQQTSGNSHPHSHQQQPVVQHQQQFQHHQVPITFFPYPLSQIHPAAAAAATQHQHPGQTSVGNNVGGGPQMAPSPPIHTSGNGNQQQGNNMSVINNTTAGNNTNNANNMGGNRPQGNNSNTVPHYAAGSALMQAPPPNNTHFMTSTAYHMQLQQQNAAVMVAAQYNSVAAAAAVAGQHGNLGGGGNGQAGHALYQTTQQTQPTQTHQQATLHYFSNPAVNAAHAQTQLHHPPQHHQLRSMLAAVTNPRQPYLVPQPNYFTLSHATLPPPPRTSLLTNAHQQSAAAAASGVGATGGSTVHVATQLQNTSTRGTAAAGPTTYISAPFCTPPLQMGAGTTLAQQPASMLTAATGIGQSPTLQATYGHISGLPTAQTSTTSLNIPTTGTMAGGGGNSSSIGTEYKGTKPRKHAIPIIDPVTLKKVSFDEPQKRSTVVEVRPPPPPLPTASVETEQSQSKTKATSAIEIETAETITMNMENDKSITVSVASAPTLSPPPASLTPPPPLPLATVASITKDKIDQQMQTDAVKEKPISITTTTTPPQSLPAAESLQTCIEDPDDTDADTNEHELDNDDDVIDDISLEQRISASYMDCELTANLNINQEEISVKEFELHTGESDTEDHTTETEVKSTSQIDDDIAQYNQLDAKCEELALETTLRQQNSTHIIHKISSQISLEKNEVLEAKEALSNTDITKTEERENFKTTLQSMEQVTDEQQLPSLSATLKNEQKNIKTSSPINVTSTTKNKDQIKSIKTANTVITLPPSNSGHVKNSKQNPIANVTTQKQTANNNESAASKTNQNQMFVQNTSASSSHNNSNSNNNNNNNNNSFITVGKSKNRKLSKRTKENQKKSQQHQQQQQQHQQQKIQEPSSSSANACNQRSNNSATYSNNKNSNSINNNTNLSASSNAATNILLTDIHNANSSSISSSISGNNLREQNKQQQHHQQHQQEPTSKSNNNNSNRNSGVGQYKGMDSKNETENQRKHTKTQEIVTQILQPTTVTEISKPPEQQLQFLSSSSSTCKDEEETLLKQEPTQQDLVAPIDVHFGDFKENEKLIDTKVTTISTKGSQNKQKNLHTDTVDCSSNLPPPHTRGGVAATSIHSKSHNKGHHNIATTGSGTVHKHKAAKQQHHQPLIRYSLEELKALAISPQSQKTPVVPCLRNDYISQLFVSDLQQQYQTQHGGGGHNIASTNLQLQQQYQHMNFNESMEFVTGKRRGGGGGQTRKHYDQHTNSGNINSNIINNMLPGSSTGNSSISGQFPRKMEVIRIHLSLNEEIKLSECANAWQPGPLRSSKSNNTSPTAGPNDDIEVVLKKVRGILNKLTPDNFDVLLKTMTSISMNTQEKMQQVMLLIFEKTVSEPNFAPTYAKFCNVLFQEIKPESKKMFNASLIKRIQTEFEVNVNDADAKKLKLQPLVDKMEATTDAKERNELQAEIEDQEYQFRRRAWGTVRFIGEMYKLQSLTGDRVLLCIESLLEHGSEEKLEYMCKLLTTVGHLLDGNGPEHYSNNNIRMEKIFRKIQEIVNEAKSTAKSSGGNASSSMVTNAKTGMQTKISSRVRFMMQDVMDLRNRNWDQVGTNASKYSAPQTQAIATGTQQQQHRRNRQQDDKSNNQSSGSSSGNYERSGGNQRSYANNNQRPARLMMQQDMRDSGSSSGGNYFMQKPLKSQFLAQQEQQSIDLKKLNFSRGDVSTETTTKLGTKNAYMWRNTSRPTTQQNFTTSASMGLTSSQYLGGKGGQQNSNSMNTRNSFKRHTSNQFQVLSSSSSREHNTEMEKSSISASSSSINDNASDEDDKLYTTKDNQKLLNHLIEEYLDCLASHSDNWQNEVLTSWQATTQKQQISLVYFILMEYLHSAAVKKLQRNACATIFAYLLRCKAFDKKTFARAYEQFAEEFPDLLVDVPNGWTYVFEFLGPILHERLLNFSDIWQPSWRDDRHFIERFVNALIEHFTKEFGANYVRDLWHNEYKLDRGQLFINDQQKWHEFIQKYKLQYIYDCNTKPPQMEMKNSTTSATSSSSSTLSTTQEQQVKRLEMLLKTANDCDLAIDYINTNVNVNNNFLRNLTQFLCCDYATIMINTSASSTATTTTVSSSGSNSSRNRTNIHNKKNNNDLSMDATATTSSGSRPHLNVDLFRKNCLPLLRLCLDAQEDFELTCLDAVVDSIQQYHDINTANELICGIFDILYDCEVIAKESFEKWYRQRQQQSKQQENSATSKHKANNYKNPLSGQLQQYMQKLL